MQTATQRREFKGRPEDKPDNAQMRRVARMYYLEGLTRQKISEQLGLDPRRTSWLLDMALKLGVVRIDIRGETDDEQLTERLQRRFPHLKKAIIASPGPPITTAEDAPLYTPLLRNLAVLAADYFDELVSRQEQENPGQPFRIGISGGETLYEFVKAVPEKLRPNVHVHATSVVAHGQLETFGHVDPSTNCTNLWTKAGGLPGQCHYTTMTPYDTDPRGLPEARKFIKRELKRLTANRKIEAVLREAQNIDVAFAGLGTLTPPPGADALLMNRLTMMSLLQPIITMEDLSQQKPKPVGDLSYCLFDENGDSRDDWRFFPMAGDFSEYKGVDFYRHMVEQRKTVIAIVGPYKLAPIKAALKGKLLNVLIIDEHSAREILEGS
jgi:deoxyribonucleoside regulator